MILQVERLMSEIQRRLRSEIPKEHCTSNDSRLAWLWNQRMAVAQAIFSRTTDVQSRMAASLVLSAGFTHDLGAITLLLQRLEGGAITDQEVLERDSMPL